VHHWVTFQPTFVALAISKHRDSDQDYKELKKALPPTPIHIVVLKGLLVFSLLTIMPYVHFNYMVNDPCEPDEVNTEVVSGHSVGSWQHLMIHRVWRGLRHRPCTGFAIERSTWALLWSTAAICVALALYLIGKLLECCCGDWILYGSCGPLRIIQYVFYELGFRRKIPRMTMTQRVPLSMFVLLFLVIALVMGAVSYMLDILFVGLLATYIYLDGYLIVCNHVVGLSPTVMSTVEAELNFASPALFKLYETDASFVSVSTEECRQLDELFTDELIKECEISFGVNYTHSHISRIYHVDTNKWHDLRDPEAIHAIREVELSWKSSFSLKDC
jgi:hypothetical protein